MTGAPYVPDSGLRAKLARRWTRLSARAPAPAPKSARVVSVTFDDFPASAAQAGLDALAAFNAPATYYAAMGLAGERTHLGAMMTKADVRRVAEAGHEVACHTFSHPDCAALDRDGVLAEVERNAYALADAGVEHPRSFAFPYGEATPAAKRALRGRFATLRGVQAGVNGRFADRALLRSTLIAPGGVDAVEAVRRFRGGWLILFTHDVTDDPSPWGCRPADLRAVLTAVQESGAETLTVASAAERFGMGAQA